MLKPIGSNILVKPRIEETTESGIILTVSNRDREAAQIGEVIAVGDLVSEDIEVGMTLLFAKYAGEQIEDEDETYLIISEDDAIAISQD